MNRRSWVDLCVCAPRYPTHTTDDRSNYDARTKESTHTKNYMNEDGSNFAVRTKGTWCAHTHIKRTMTDDDSVGDPLIKRRDGGASSQRRLRTNSSPNPRNAPRTIASNGKPGIPMPDPSDVVCIDEVELVWTTSMMYPRTNRSCVAVPL